MADAVYGPSEFSRSRAAHRLLSGIAAGFTATTVISVLMFIQSWMTLYPEVDIIQALVKVSTVYFGAPLLPWIGWLEHFFIGTVVWGILFALIEPVLPRPDWLAGIVFGLTAWIVMMVVLMPAAGVGLFGADLGFAAPVISLVVHTVYGAILGIAFAILNVVRGLPVPVSDRRPVPVRGREAAQARNSPP